MRAVLFLVAILGACSAPVPVEVGVEQPAAIVVACPVTPGIELGQAVEYWARRGYPVTVGAWDDNCSILVAVRDGELKSEGQTTQFEGIPASPDYPALVELQADRWPRLDRQMRAAVLVHELGHALGRQHNDGEPIMSDPWDMSEVGRL